MDVELTTMNFTKKLELCNVTQALLQRESFRLSFAPKATYRLHTCSGVLPGSRPEPVWVLFYLLTPM